MANHVDQAVAGLKKADQYIQYGLTTLPELAGEYLAVNPNNAKDELEYYKALMMQYIEMDQDTKLYTKTLQDIKQMVSLCCTYSVLYLLCAVLTLCCTYSAPTVYCTYSVLCLLCAVPV